MQRVAEEDEVGYSAASCLDVVIGCALVEILTGSRGPSTSSPLVPSAVLVLDLPELLLRFLSQPRFDREAARLQTFGY